MSTPAENLEIAVDESAEREDRERAIHDLEAANACDKLASVVQNSELADEIRSRALDALATDQCEATLRELAETEGLVPERFREEAASSLGDVQGAR